MKQEQEKTWSEPTNRTIYQWSETSKAKNGAPTTRQSVWTQTVRNRMRQKAGEIQAYRAYEKGVEKWWKEHIRKGKGDISEEGQEILEDKDIRGNRTALLGATHPSRKRERSSEDGLFLPHQKGPILFKRRAKDDAGEQNVQQTCKEEAFLERNSFVIIIALHY